MEAYKPNNFCKVSGQNMAYYRQGQGEIMFLVHGITTYGFIWRNMIDQLSRHFDIICIDLLGCGYSDKPLDVSYSLKSHAECIVDFAENMGIDKFHFVCHDVGGGIGQILAVNYPD